MTNPIPILEKLLPKLYDSINNEEVRVTVNHFNWSPIISYNIIKFNGNNINFYLMYYDYYDDGEVEQSEPYFITKNALLRFF